MRIRNDLAVLMAKKKIKIAQLSRITGISRTTLTSLYYNNEKAITYETIEKLCEALECTISELLIPI